MRQPALSERGEARGLPGVDGLRCRNEGSGAPRLHFDERVSARVATDEVDLTEARAHVPSDHAKPATGELAFCEVLAGESEKATRLHPKGIGRALR